MGGKFKFTREVPQAIGPNIDFDNTRKSFETKKKRRKGEENEHELETLNKVKGVNDDSGRVVEIVINNWQ